MENLDRILMQLRMLVTCCWRQVSTLQAGETSSVTTLRTQGTTTWTMGNQSPGKGGEDRSQVSARPIPKRIALQEALSPDVARRERGWKLLMGAPRMFLSTPPSPSSLLPPEGGFVCKEKLTLRFEKFTRGELLDFIFESAAAAEEASTVSRRRGRRVRDPLEQRAARALALVQVGELSSARQALDGGSRVGTPQQTHVVGVPEPSTSTSCAERTNPWRFMELAPPRFDLDESLFGKRDTHFLFLVSEQLARAQVPPSIVSLIRQGRLTALSKDDGGVRGIVARDVARTMARQLSEAVEAATAPF